MSYLYMVLFIFPFVIETINWILIVSPWDVELIETWDYFVQGFTQPPPLS